MRIFVKQGSSFTPDGIITNNIIDILDNDEELSQRLQDKMSDYSPDSVLILGLIQNNSADQRKLAGELFNHATNGAKMAQNLAEAETLKAEIKAKFAITDDLYELKVISAELQVALKVIESGGKLGLVRDEETGKLKTKGGKSGNGDRANPLPPIDETNFIQSGKNGDTVIAIRTSALVGTGNKRDDPFKPNMWQAFRSVDGKYENWGTLCSELNCSWSKVNQTINNRVRDNPGKNVGTGGMLEVSRLNVETALAECGHGLKTETELNNFQV